MDSAVSKIACFSVIFFGVFSIFPIEKRGVLLLLLVLSAVLLAVKNKKFKLHKLVIINAVLYVSYGLALLYTTDLEGSFKRFETGSALILAPLLFSSYYLHENSIFSEDIKLKFYKTFHWSNLIFAGIIIAFFGKLKFVDNQSSYGYWMSHLERELPLLGDHPIYISMIFCSSALMSISYLLSKSKTKKFKVVYGITTLILVALVLFLSRKGVILAFLTAILLMVAFRFRDNLKRVSLVVVVSVFVFGGLLFVIPQTKNRISELFKKESYSSQNETNSTNNRIQIYECAFDLIKEQPILGYGIEDDRNELNKCYKERLYYLYEFSFNTHNQYLSIVMKIGVVGLLFFLGFLMYNIRLAYKAEDFLGISIITFFMIIMLFENILERQNGALLFSFLINYFSFKNYLRINSNNNP